MTEEQTYDVVIVGGGVAGLTAALVLGRARRTVAVIDAGAPRNAPAHAAYGFLTRDGTPPADLVALGRKDLAPYAVTVLDGDAHRASDADGGRIIHLDDGRRARGRQILLATGLRDVLPDIPGAREAWGRGLLQCPYCHGWEVQDQPLGVFGSEAASVDHALLIRQWSEDVTFYPHRLGPLGEEDAERLRSRGVRVAEGAVRGFELAAAPDDGGPRALRGVRLDDGSVLPCSAMFCEPGSDGGSPLVTDLGCERRDDGCVVTDELGRTSEERVWAVGNIADPSAQLLPAAGDAYRVAVTLNAILVREDCEALLKAAEAADDT